MADTKYWLGRLQEGFDKAHPGKKHRIRLPSGISFVTKASGVRIALSKHAIEHGNMQSDAAAFEAWSLALHGYAQASTVELSWTGSIAGLHAWRFRLRAHQFERLFKKWFTLDGLLEPPFDSSHKYVLNVEAAPRKGPIKPFSTNLRERELETFIVRDGNTARQFRETFRLDVVGQQLPVGVFKGKVSKKTAVSPRGSAAIDIWGIQGKTLHLFELKKFPGRSGGKPFGIISELFLYTSTMRALQSGLLTFAGVSKDAEFKRISETDRIEAWLLAPAFHPLIEYGDAPILNLINDGFKAANEPVRFKRARIGRDASIQRT